MKRKTARMIDTALTHLILIAVCFIFLFPCLWLILAVTRRNKVPIYCSFPAD